MTHYEHKQKCRSEPVHRMVTRYENQLAQVYVPPRTDYISQHYTDWEMVETPQTCQAAAPEMRGNYVEGVVYLAQTLPAANP